MLLWPLAKLDIKKSISTIFCIKKKKEEEATQLLHLHCYKKQQYNSFGTATTEERDDLKSCASNIMLDILYTLSLVKYQRLQIFHHKNFGSELSIGFCIELYSEIEANFNFQLTQKCLFVRGPYRWHMLNFFFIYLQRWPSWIDKKNPKHFQPIRLLVSLIQMVMLNWKNMTYMVEVYQSKIYHKIEI